MSKMTPDFAIKVLASTKVASNYSHGPKPYYGYQNQCFYDKARNLAIAAIRENQELKAVIAALQEKISELKMAKEMRVFVPSTADWNDLLAIVGEDNELLHWKEMFFWCRDIVKSLCRANCGYNSAHYCTYNLSGRRSVVVGFRPAFVPLDAGALKPGDKLVQYALYLDGAEQTVPTNPTCSGDIKSYQPGQRIQIKESTRPETAITWFYNGRCYVADRVLLNKVSYDDLEILSES